MLSNRNIKMTRKIPILEFVVLKPRCIYYANERPPAPLPPERPAPPGLSPVPPTGWAKVNILC